jgi:hypothetical protein
MNSDTGKQTGQQEKLAGVTRMRGVQHNGDDTACQSQESVKPVFFQWATGGAGRARRMAE